VYPRADMVHASERVIAHYSNATSVREVFVQVEYPDEKLWAIMHQAGM